MKIRYRLTVGIIGVLLALLISLSGQPSLGFEVTGNSAGDAGKQEILYKGKDGQQFSNKLDPSPIEALSAEKAARFLDKKYKEKLIVSDIKGNFNYTGWTFKIASHEELLDGFNINNYYVCIPDKECPDVSYINENGSNIFFGIYGSKLPNAPRQSGGVGLYIDLTFSGAGVRNRLGLTETVHWIQFVEDASQKKDDKGNAQPFIDVPFNISDPYYDHQGSPAGTAIVAGTYFVDKPYTSDETKVYAKTHAWKAELYLVQETAPKTVTIYNGIRYGYHNEKKNDQISEDPCQSQKNQNSEQCKLKQGRSHDDPHLATFDGFRYDLQTLGEFILTKSNDGTFEVQTRQAPYASSLSINSAIAMKVGSDRVALYAREFPDADTSTPLRVNGKPTTIQGDKLDLPSGGQILKQGSTYVISSPRGEKVLVSPSGAGNTAFFNISPFVYNRSGQYSGLLGNVNGNPNDDLQIRGGNNILEVKSTYGDVNQALNLVGLRLPGALDTAEKVYFDQLYKQFANSWRVKQEESLFDYPTGKTTKSYTNPSFPDKYLTLNMLSADQIQKARNACTEAKVTQDLMEGCIFDVGFSGFSEFARTAAEVNGYIGIVNQLFPGLNIPTPEQTVNRFIEKHKPRACIGPFCL